MFSKYPWFQVLSLSWFQVLSVCRSVCVYVCLSLLSKYRNTIQTTDLSFVKTQARVRPVMIIILIN